MSSFHLLLSRSNQLFNRLSVINSLNRGHYLKQSPTCLLPTYSHGRFAQTSAPPPRQSAEDRAGKADPEPRNAKEYRDQIMYTVKFKEMNLRKIFKEFYSFYGPLFVVCHIGVSLTSVGFFCTLVSLTVNPMALMPDFIMQNIVEHFDMSVTEAGSKFLVAYAIHKLFLPIRVVATIALTRFLAPKVKLKWKSKTTSAGGDGSDGAAVRDKTTGKE